MSDSELIEALRQTFRNTWFHCLAAKKVLGGRVLDAAKLKDLAHRGLLDYSRENYSGTCAYRVRP